MSKRVKDILGRGQQGFTLIELVAVMAIMAVLVAVVAPSVTGTRNASIDAQVMQDATQLRSAATNFYKSQNEAEVRTSHKVTTTAKLPPTNTGTLAAPGTLAVVTEQQQMVSSRWPERYITLQHTAVGTNPVVVAAAPVKVKQIGAVYPMTIPTNPADNIDSVILLDKNGYTISGATFLEDYTAVDLDTLVGRNYLGNAPAGIDSVSNGIPNFLWLFLKASSSTSNVDDSREVVVFKLVKVEKIESDPATKKLVVRADVTGTHTGSTSSTTLTDSAASFVTAGVVIGEIITNLTDGSSGAITALTATTITVAALTGGTERDWDNGDSYRIGNAALPGRVAAPSVIEQVDTTNELNLTYERIF